MKSRHLVFLVLAVFALTACRRGETATVTGGYGSNVVSGNVVMQSGASPAGVQVSVRGTGMSSTLDADGQFVFAGVPEDAVLDFRSPDGLEASLALEGSSSLTVELSANGAKKRGKRRGAGSGNPLTQFEGVVRSAAAEQVVVYTSHQEEVTIALTAQTTIRKGNTPLTPAALLAGTRVHVKAAKTDAGYDAVAILVQGGDEDGGGDDAPPAVTEYEGTVVSAAAAQLVIFDSHRTEQTFALDAQTVIRKGNTPVLAADIQPGWRVHVKATGAADGSKTAVRVTVQNDREQDDEVKWNGTIATTTPSLTVSTSGGTVTITTDASTRIEKKGDEILLTDLAAGDRVKVEGTRVGATTVLAKEIEVK